MKYIYILIALIVIVVALLLFKNQSFEGAKSLSDSTSIPQPQSTETNQAPSMVSEMVPEKYRGRVAELYEFAKAANLYNFDPKITGWQDDANAVGRIVGATIETPTHDANWMGNILMAVTSKRDSSNPLEGFTPEIVKGWAQGTGKMSEKEAVDETKAILERIHATKTLAELGRYEYKARPAFVTVDFYAKDDRDPNHRILEAEFRMGSNGPVGLTKWWHWP